MRPNELLDSAQAEVDVQNLCLVSLVASLIVLFSAVL